MALKYLHGGHNKSLLKSPNTEERSFSASCLPLPQKTIDLIILYEKRGGNAILLFTATDHLTVHEDDQEYWQRGEYHVNVIISVFFISCHNLLKCCQQQPVKLAVEL